MTGGVSQDTSTQILYGSAMGTFSVGPVVPTRGDRSAIGNLNGDAPLDLVTGALGAVDGGMGPVVEVRMGAANNTLGAATQIPVRAIPTFLTIAEVSNDTRLDIVVGSSLGIDVITNLGSGMFGPPVVVSSTGVSSLAVADLNLDGRRDLLAVGVSFNSIQPWLNVGLPGNAGFLVGTSVVPATSTNFSILVDDLTYDGKPDFLFGQRVYQGNGAGGFTLYSSSMPVQPPRQLLVDLDNSGSLDVAAAGAASSVLSVLPGTSSAAFGFATTPSGYSPGAVVEDLALGRMNTDGLRDLIVLVGTPGNRAVVAAPGVCR